jgi:hypothetical protein
MTMLVRGVHQFFLQSLLLEAEVDVITALVKQVLMVDLVLAEAQQVEQVMNLLLVHHKETMVEQVLMAHPIMLLQVVAVLVLEAAVQVHLLRLEEEMDYLLQFQEQTLREVAVELVQDKIQLLQEELVVEEVQWQALVLPIQVGALEVGVQQEQLVDQE